MVAQSLGRDPHRVAATAAGRPSGGGPPRWGRTSRHLATRSWQTPGFDLKAWRQCLNIILRARQGAKPHDVRPPAWQNYPFPSARAYEVSRRKVHAAISHRLCRSGKHRPQTHCECGHINNVGGRINYDLEALVLQDLRLGVRRKGEIELPPNQNLSIRPVADVAGLFDSMSDQDSGKTGPMSTGWLGRGFLPGCCGILVCRSSREAQQNCDSCLAAAVDQFMIRLVVIRKKAPIATGDTGSWLWKLRTLCWVLRRLRAGSGVFEENGGDDKFGEPERHHPFPKGNFQAKILS